MDGSSAPKSNHSSRSSHAAHPQPMALNSSNATGASDAPPPSTSERHTSSQQHQHQHASGSRPSAPAAATASAGVPLPLATAALAAATAASAGLPSTSAACMVEGTPTVALAVDNFRGGVGQLQHLLEELSMSLELERAELQGQRESLDHERRVFEEECLRVKHELQGSEQVKLNIGGLRFTTTAGTLRNAPAPSLFSAMFSGRHSLKTDESGCYFLDRDGRHFHEILNFLRDGVLNYPADGTDYKYLLELRAEAEYYGLVGLLQQIDRYPYGLVRVQRAATLNLDDSWMYEDGQDEVVFTVGSACHLLGVGLCGTEGGLTVELEVYEVEPADFSAEVCTLQTTAQSFTKVDGQILRMLLPSPALLQPGKCYMLSALIKGSESYCCEDGMETCIAGGVKVMFQSWESPNGTNELRGQFPEIYLRPV